VRIVGIAAAHGRSLTLHPSRHPGGLTAPEAKRVLVDLSKVTFFDSTGINTLVKNHRRAGDQDVKLQVVNPSKMALRVLDITGVLGFICGDE
jgi:anti-anti-sigma factor